VDEVVRAANAIEGALHGGRVEGIALGDLGPRGGPATQRFGPPDEAAQGNATALELCSKPAAHVAGRAGQENAVHAAIVALGPRRCPPVSSCG